ncbi:hypothetical protein RyT2_13600 [Pseudolactococcus yaeyamensis]
MKLVSVLNELPIVGIQEGEVLGVISKVFVSKETKRVKYLISNTVKQANIPTAIDFKAVRGLGEDYAVILKASELKTFSDESIVLDDTVDIIGTTVLVDSGDKIGNVTDFEIDEKTGAISKAILDTEKTFVGSQIISLSEHFVIVTENLEGYQEIDDTEEVQTPDSEKDTVVEEKKTDTIESEQVAQEIPTEVIPEVTEDAAEEAIEPDILAESSTEPDKEDIELDQAMVKFLVGKMTVAKTVSEDGSFSIEAGVPLTEKVIEAASQNGILTDLVMNV